VQGQPYSRQGQREKKSKIKQAQEPKVPFTYQLALIIITPRDHQR